MTDLTITQANVQPVTGSTVLSNQFYCGTTLLTQGQPVYPDPVSRMLLPSTAVSTAGPQTVGITMSQAAYGQPISVATGGNIIVGATLTTGAVYIVSANSGKLAPVSDLSSGMYPVVAFIAYSTTGATMSLASNSPPTPHS